jgi:hypothetical protein
MKLSMNFNHTFRDVDCGARDRQAREREQEQTALGRERERERGTEGKLSSLLDLLLVTEPLASYRTR